VPFRVETVLDKAEACSRRLQNSPSAQTVVIAYLALRQALLTKTLSMAAQMDFFWATETVNLQISQPRVNYKESELVK
jgi:hypothetical protein